MALEYALIVLGRTRPEDMVSRLGLERRDFELSKGVWTADLRRERGFILHLRSAKHGYFESDDWTLEPDKYLHVGFRADKEADPQFLARSLIDTVERALATGGEDMAFIQNGEVLVLERTGGEVRRLPVGFWNNVDP
jgi:hypothetical protein